jgi:predicted XRE-type DNA-binding protein
MSNSYTKSSGNVFQDLDLKNAKELHAKANLADGIASIIEEKSITQQSAADIVGTSQAKISDVIHGRLDKFTMDRLIRMLLAFDRDVKIEIKPSPPYRSHDAVVTAVAV